MFRLPNGTYQYIMEVSLQDVITGHYPSHVRQPLRIRRKVNKAILPKQKRRSHFCKRRLYFIHLNGQNLLFKFQIQSQSPQLMNQYVE